ncbi:MAG: hypothetical protein K2O32_04460 [Acetatifactor sp.]|nr:hypothetical protein [Acetatifactor sp.]
MKKGNRQISESLHPIPQRRINLCFCGLPGAGAALNDRGAATDKRNETF